VARQEQSLKLVSHLRLGHRAAIFVTGREQEAQDIVGLVPFPSSRRDLFQGELIEAGGDCCEAALSREFLQAPPSSLPAPLLG
jgi:hypothetical protein